MPLLASAKGSVVTNLIATFKALGGGWEMREGREVVPLETQEQMRQRTNWGDLLPSNDFPRPEQEALTGQEIKIFNKPDF